MSERLGPLLRSGGLQQGLHNGLMGGGLFSGASLDLNFAANKNIGPLVTFTRASSGTYTDSQGVLRTATTNEPRFDHNPTTGESLGLLVEEQRTNLLLNSSTLSTQNVTVTAVAHTLSFTGTGTITLSGTSTAGPLVGTGTGEANRVSLTFTPTAGTLTLTVSGTVTNAQLEIGSFRTSYIPTTTATATRSADVASITGTNFSSWYRQDEGTVFSEFALGGVASQNKVVNFDAGAGFADSIDMYCVSGTPRYEVYVGSVVQAQLGMGPSIGTNAATKVIGAYKANDFGATRSGGVVITDASGTLPSTVRMGIGAQLSGGQYLNGTIRRLAYWPARLSNQTLQTISGPALTTPVGSDPYFSSVSLLLHMDGSNGSTTFTDSSSNALTLSRAGDAQISTAQSKFGGASGLFDGTGDYLTATSSGFSFGTGDFTFEGWMRLANTTGYKAIASFQSGSDNNTVYMNSASFMWWDEGVARASIPGLSANVWYHFAVTRQAGTLRTFIDGVKASSDYTSLANITSGSVRIGTNGNANTEWFNGYLDDIRITKGVARYTANFTPPTAAFPDN